jgi:hypothetical protein
MAGTTAARAVTPWLLIPAHVLSTPANVRAATRQAEDSRFERGQDVSRDIQSLRTFGESAD